MKQIGLLPSGCQPWNKNIIDGRDGHFVYCSTLATYQHSLNDFHLERLTAAHEKTITGLCFSSQNPQQYFTCGVDLKLSQWDVREEKELQSLQVPAPPAAIEVSPADDELIAVLLKPGTVHIWGPVSRSFENVDILNKSKDISVIRWNYSSGAGKLACGHLDGTISIWDRASNNVQKIDPTEKRKGMEVLDLAWDPLSNSYLVAAFSNGYLQLVDSESGVVATEFARQTFDVSMIAFVPSIPGGFLTVNERAAVLALWNVSQVSPLELIKLHKKKCGMLAIKPVRIVQQHQQQQNGSAGLSAGNHGGLKFLLAFSDGSVGVFEWENRRLAFSSVAAHSETIFDCRYKPANPSILATASYDGTIKIWDTEKLQCINDLKGQEGVLYAVTWCPGGDDEFRLMSSSSTGELYLWNTDNGQVLNRFRHHNKAVYRMAWNSADPELICSTSSDQTAIVFNPTGAILKKYKHPASVYGCDWNRANKNLLVTACHDGVLRVWDISSNSQKPIAEFSGHGARAFNVVWSPLITDRFASGSDDRTIRIWSVNSSQCIVLYGHTHNVRALVWSEEIPYLLLSGSWDGTIRIWDIRSEKCLYIIDDHHADVYGLVSHPQRPFVFASSSRDTSLRFWTMDETLLLRLKISAVLDGGVIQPSLLEDALLAMKPTAPLRFSGAVSSQLSKALLGMKNELGQFAALFDFFSSLSGTREVFALLDAMVNQRPSPSASLVPHVADLRGIHFQSGRQLELGRVRFGEMKKRERLESAADVYLRLGHVRQYCELMIEIDEWERAIAVAPAHSIQYWKSLTARYAQVLAQRGDMNAVGYFLAGGQVTALTHFQLKQREQTAALLTAVSDALGALPRIPDFQDSDTDAAKDKKKEEEKTGSKRDEVPVTDLIRSVVDYQSSLYFASASPVLSASCHLCVNDAMRAVQRLVFGNEVLLAAAICRILKLQFVDFVYRALADQCEHLWMWDEALRALSLMRDPKDDIVLMASRFVGAANKRVEFFAKCSIRTAEQFLSSAEEFLKDGKRLEALTPLVAAGAHERAANLGCDLLHELLSSACWSVDEANAITRALNSISVSGLPNELRTQVLLYSYYIGAHHAMNRNYANIVAFLFDAVHMLLQKSAQSQTGHTFPVPSALIRLEEAQYFACLDPTRALSLIKDVLSEPSSSSASSAGGGSAAKWKAAANSLKKLIELNTQNPSSSGSTLSPILVSGRFASRHVYIPSCSNLPSGSWRKASCASLISKQFLEGGRVVLEDGMSCIALSEALMLLKCTPFSPLHQGVRVNIGVA